MSSLNLNGEKDLTDLVSVIANVVQKKVDMKYVFEWNKIKAGLFIIQAFQDFLKFKDLYKQQKDEVNNLLTKNQLYMDSAFIAKDVYRTGATELQHGWEYCKEFNNISFCDSSTGLVSALYCRSVDGKKEYIYATAGTNPKNLDDWKANIEQLYGDSIQYKQALEIAMNLSTHIAEKGEKLTFVGHSLGGGIAINNAFHTGNKAVVFNPVGLSSETMQQLPKEYSMKEVNEMITAFISTNDVLNWMQDTSQHFEGMKQVIPATVGTKYYIYSPLVFPFKSHTIEQVIRSMEKALV